MNIFGIGIDIVQNNRIRQIIFKPYARNFFNKVLHPEQIKQYQKIKMLSVQTQFIASRWAVKQATVKALGRRQLIFHNMKIIKNESGKPHLQLQGKTNIQIAKSLQIQKILISLAHQEQYTIANSMAMKKFKPYYFQNYD